MSAHFKTEAGKGKAGLSVSVGNNFEKALRIFKKKVTTDGILRDVKDRQQYEKPSVKGRRRRAEAKRRWVKQQAQMRADEI